MLNPELRGREKKRCQRIVHLGSDLERIVRRVDLITDGAPDVTSMNYATDAIAIALHFIGSYLDCNIHCYHVGDGGRDDMR